MPITFGILLFGCAENGAVDPAPPKFDPATSVGATLRLVEARTDSLAKGLALALDDGGVRTRLRDDLRDSPFPLHALHLGTYLRGADGGVMAAKAAAALGIGLIAFLNISASAPTLELVIPRSLDRISWDGGVDIDVVATSGTLSQRREENRVSERGYDIRGNAVAVPNRGYRQRASMIIRPAEHVFPAEPELARATAPKHARNTVSTAAEERAALIQLGIEKVSREKAAGLTSASGIVFDGSPRMSMPLPCDPNTEECPPEESPPSPPGVGGGGATLSAEMTKNYCYGITSVLNATNDRDNDRIRDDCELAIASSLSPLLNIGLWEDWWARQSYWSASRHPDRDGNVQIIYAIGYLDDGGDFDTGWFSHVGDSEFIILEVINSTASIWGVVYATLSAHFQASYDDTSTYYWDDLQYPGGAFPRIWASLSKHGNYRTRAACEGSFLATCQYDYQGFRIPLTSAHNLGNYFHLPEASRNPITQLANCTSYETYPQFDRTGQECFWDDTDRFSGWDPTRPDDVMPYRAIFEFFGF